MKNQRELVHEFVHFDFHVFLFSRASSSSWFWHASSSRPWPLRRRSIVPRLTNESNGVSKLHHWEAADWCRRCASLGETRTKQVKGGRQYRCASIGTRHAPRLEIGTRRPPARRAPTLHTPSPSSIHHQLRLPPLGVFGGDEDEQVEGEAAISMCDWDEARASSQIGTRRPPARVPTHPATCPAIAVPANTPVRAWPSTAAAAPCARIPSTKIRLSRITASLNGTRLLTSTGTQTQARLHDRPSGPRWSRARPWRAASSCAPFVRRSPSSSSPGSRRL